LDAANQCHVITQSFEARLEASSKFPGVKTNKSVCFSTPHTRNEILFDAGANRTTIDVVPKTYQEPLLFDAEHIKIRRPITIPSSLL